MINLKKQRLLAAALFISAAVFAGTPGDYSDTVKKATAKNPQKKQNVSAEKKPADTEAQKARQDKSAYRQKSYEEQAAIRKENMKKREEAIKKEEQKKKQ